MFLQQNFIDISNELASVLLGVYDSWWKVDTMGVTFRRRIISAIRAISKMDYFRKTDGRPEWERPKRDMQIYLKIGK